MIKKVVHLTSVHDRNDIRIFLKECISLKNNGYDVSLILGDGLGDEIINNIKIYDVGKDISRFDRMFKTTKRVLKKAIDLDADLYHFHDPELMSAGLKLKKKGKKVIYDMHEYTPKSILVKDYIPKYIRYFFSKIIENYENFVVKKIDSLITVSEHIGNRFNQKKVTIIRNYALLKETINPNSIANKDKNNVCFTGLINKERGIKEMMEASKKSETKLLLAGKFDNEEFTKSYISNKNIYFEYLGILKREELYNYVYKKSFVGLVIYQMEEISPFASPNKMFEYMNVGVPIIASNYPLWKKIVEENSCGICVDPNNIEEIVNAIKTIKNDKNMAKRMSENCIKTVKEKYNWEIEEKKLFGLYKKLLG